MSVPPAPPLTGLDGAGPHALPGVPLPMAGAQVAERADAARNRRRLLDAARTLVLEHGPCGVTMDALARAAGVGKGTVFRRFGDRTGLMLALLDHTEMRFQEALLEGPAPLGPGSGPTDPLERLDAFGRARLELVVGPQGALFAEADDGTVRRYAVPARAVHVIHVRAMLEAAGARGDLELLTEGLLAALDPQLARYLALDRGIPLARLQDAWCAQARLVAAAGRDRA